MSAILFYSLVNLLFLIFWFETDAFAVYLNLLPGDYFGVKKYFALRSTNFALTYPGFLLNQANSPKRLFAAKLVNCVYCLNFWLSAVYVFAVGLDFIVVQVLTLFLYFAFDKLEGKG